MIGKIKDQSQQQLFVGSKVTLDPAVITPNGPFGVLSLDPVNSQYTVDGAGLEGTALGMDIIIDVDNSTIPQELIDFGNGVQALMFNDAANLVRDLQAVEASLMQQVKDLQSGAAIKPLQDQIVQLTASNDAMKKKIADAVNKWPVGVGDTMNAVQTILTT